jgi:hypothetical protein
METEVETSTGSFTGNTTMTANMSIPNLAPLVLPSTPSTSTNPMLLAPEMVQSHLPSALHPNTQEKRASKSTVMVTPSTAVMDVDMDVNYSVPFTHSAAGEKPDFNLDPFADGTGLTAEELAEISMDPDAEEDDEDTD